MSLPVPVPKQKRIEVENKIFKFYCADRDKTTGKVAEQKNTTAKSEKREKKKMQITTLNENGKWVNRTLWIYIQHTYIEICVDASSWMICVCRLVSHR